MLPLDLDDSVAHVFSTKSKLGNGFFEVKFKITEATCVTLRIMKQANQTITENYLLRLNKEREPVTFKKLSKTPKSHYFFNTPKEMLYKSQRLLTLITTKNTSKKLTSLQHKILEYLI